MKRRVELGELIGGLKDAFLTVMHVSTRALGRSLLFAAVLVSLVGEITAIFAGEPVLVVSFFLSTLFLCLAIWRGEAA